MVDSKMNMIKYSGIVMTQKGFFIFLSFYALTFGFFLPLLFLVVDIFLKRKSGRNFRGQEKNRNSIIQEERTKVTEKEKVIQIYRDVLERKRARFPKYFFVCNQGEKYLAYMTCYLIEEYLEILVENIPYRVKAETLWNHRLRPPANTYGWNFIDVMENAYPGKFHPWEYHQVSFNYWKGEDGQKRAIEAVRYVIEEKCHIPHHDIPLKINHHFFKKHRLMGPFDLFGQSPYQVINTVYPNQFKPWEFANVPMNFWKNPQNIKETMDWFLFDQIGFSSYLDALQKLTKCHFFHYKLTGLYQMAFDDRLFKVKQWILKQMNTTHFNTNNPE